MKEFAHLHLHTEYSLLDGAVRIKDIFKSCYKKGINSFALTDHGNMYAAIHIADLEKAFSTEMSKKAGITKEDDFIHPVKPIIGSEFYFVENIENRTKEERYHLVLLAKNMQGYHNIVKLSSYSYTKGMYYKPRIDMNLLKQYSEGIICLTGCLAGYIPQRLLAGDYEGAKKHAIELMEVFGSDNTYIEIQSHYLKDELVVNPLLKRLSIELGLKLVATNDVHYLEKEDAEAQDVMMCIQMGKKLNDPDRMKFENDSFYLKTYEEMQECLKGYEEAIDNVQEIVDKCELLVFNKDSKLPPYKPADNSEPREFLTRLCNEGLLRRYGTITPEIEARAKYELDVIIKMGFAQYYLIVWDFIAAAKEMNVPVGAGRGSGVGSIVAYAIGITNVDPLRYSLIFERFLNIERVSNPDFDIDFCYDGRYKVIDYVVNKYGAEKVTQIITFGTLASKAAIKDVARVYEMPLSEVDVITKMLPGGKVHIEDVLGRNPKKADERIGDFVKLYETNPEARRVIDMAIKLEGMPRNTSIHAAGVVICEHDVSNYIPLAKNGDDITTQYNKDQVEALGLLKMDFLGLKTLTDIKKAKEYVFETKKIEIDFDKLGYDDKAVYDMIGRGETDAVFQLESPGMKKFMSDLKPDCFEDIIAGISLYRPGPMDSIPEYIKNKRNPQAIKYDHSLLEPILNVTYGIIIYQEQVMSIVRELAGYSYGRADILRRIMSKKKPEEMAKGKEVFLHGCPATEKETGVIGAVNNGVPLDVANKIYDSMSSFASYAFNKSHAAAYAVLSYETAYLKCYYPIELICAVMNDRITNLEEIAKYINYLKQMKVNGVEQNVSILKPSINKSKVGFYPENGGVRYALVGIKGVGEQAMEAMIQERNNNGEFKSFDDFVARSVNFNVNKKMVEGLIKAGAFDEFGHSRATLLATYEMALDLAQKANKMKNSEQISMFDLFDDDFFALKVEYNVKPEFPVKQLLAYEKEVLTVYVSGHPLQDYTHMYNTDSVTTKSLGESLQEQIDQQRLEEESVESDGVTVEFEQRATMFGMLQSMQRTYDKNKNEMYRGVFEDIYGSLDIVIFAKATERYKSLIQDDNIVYVSGRVSNRGGVLSMSVDRIAQYTETVAESQQQEEVVESSGNRTLFVRYFAYDNELFKKTSRILANYKGKCSVKIVVQEISGKKKTLLLDDKVEITDALLGELYGLLGVNNVIVSEEKK